MRAYMVAGIKYGLVGGFVTAVVTWRRPGVAIPIMYLIALLAGGLSGRKTIRSHSIATAALTGLVVAILSNLAFSAWVTMNAMTELSMLRGKALTPGELPYAVLGGVGGFMLNPHALGGIAIGTVLGATGGLVSRALVPSPEPTKANDDAERSNLKSAQ